MRPETVATGMRVESLRGEMSLRTASLEGPVEGTPSKKSHHKRKDSDLLMSNSPESIKGKVSIQSVMGFCVLALLFFVVLFLVMPQRWGGFRGVNVENDSSSPSSSSLTSSETMGYSDNVADDANPVATGAAVSNFDYQLEDRIRRENYRQEMRLRKSNAEEFTEQYRRCGRTDARKFLLPAAMYPRATCMDGSRPAYYLRRGTGTGASKWVVFFEGGGWCYSLEACRQRARTDLGSSLSYPEVSRSWGVQRWLDLFRSLV